MFFVVFDVNWTEGDYGYQDIRSDGSVVNATIRLFKDMDSHNASTPPPVGSSFGVTQGADDSPADENAAEDEPLTPEDLLLYVALPRRRYPGLPMWRFPGARAFIKAHVIELYNF